MGRTGTFICMHAQIERLKTEGLVDVFQFIKSARLNRPGLVQSVVSLWENSSGDRMLSEESSFYACMHTSLVQSHF